MRQKRQTVQNRQWACGFFILKKQYRDYEKRIKSILEAFHPLYEKYRYDYKMVIGESVNQISEMNEYISYIRNIHRKMPVLFMI